MDIFLTYLLVFALGIPLGLYMARVFSNQKTFTDFLAPLEGFYFRLIGVNPSSEMNWKAYGWALIASNFVLGILAMLIFLFQGSLPLNPDGIPNMSWDLALHTTASFLTNTNQQHYSGQAQLSYLSQMVGVTALQFITPAVGLAALFAILRGFKGGNVTLSDGSRGLGNYYADVTRTLTRVLIPLAVVYAVALTASGVPSTFEGARTVKLLEPQTITATDGTSSQITEQKIPLGPVAPMVAIKQLGTNGGGWYGPNSTVPLENPTPLSNLLETLALFLIPVASIFAMGAFLKRRNFALMTLGVMTVLSVLLVIAVVNLENQPNPAFAGLSSSGPNWEGKETRIGVDASALWGALTTQTSNGSVNAMHDSFNALGGMIPQLSMFLNDIYGGIGVGLINFLIFVLLTVFIAGLMVGRTPELFGRKLEAREIKMVSLVLLLQPLLILGFSALTLTNPSITRNSNPGFHGIAQVIYEYNSAYANNGSGFEGLGDNTPWWNSTTAIVLILARFLPILAPLAVAGILAAKRVAPDTLGTLRTDSAVFGGTVLSIMVILQLLNFFPVLALSHIAEALSGGKPSAVSGQTSNLRRDGPVNAVHPRTPQTLQEKLERNSLALPASSESQKLALSAVNTSSPEGTK